MMSARAFCAILAAVAALLLVAAGAAPAFLDGDGVVTAWASLAAAGTVLCLALGLLLLRLRQLATEPLPPLVPGAAPELDFDQPWKEARHG